MSNVGRNLALATVFVVAAGTGMASLVQGRDADRLERAGASVAEINESRAWQGALAGVSLCMFLALGAGAWYERKLHALGNAGTNASPERS